MNANEQFQKTDTFLVNADVIFPKIDADPRPIITIEHSNRSKNVCAGVQIVLLALGMAQI